MADTVKPEKFSFSKLDTFAQCGFKYKLKYVDKHFISAGAIALEYGTLIHDTEEQIANWIREGKPINYTSLKNRVIKKIAELEYKYKKDFFELDKSGRTYRDKTYHYLENGIYGLEKFMNEHPTYEIVGAEIPFKFDYTDRVILNGKIDRMFHDRATDTYLIQDIKTYNTALEQDDLTTPLQFVTYVIAAAHDFNISEDQIRCQFYLPLVTNQETGESTLAQDAGTKGYMKRGRDKLAKLLSEIDARKFAPNPTPLCHWCEFCPTNPNFTKEAENLCPFYSLWTKEHKTFSVKTAWNKELSFDQNMQLYEANMQGKEVKEDAQSN